MSIQNATFSLWPATGGDLQALSKTPLAYAVAFALGALLTASQYVQAKKREVNVPAIGSPNMLLSYYDAARYLFNGKAMLREGYAKYKNKAFKVPEFARWHVVVSSRALVEEVRKAPDEQLSLQEALNDTLAIDYLLGPQVSSNPYHVPVIKMVLTRNLAVVFGDVCDEIREAFKDEIPATDDWTTHTVVPVLQRIICRTSNRIFIGLPLCRDPDWRDLNVQFTIDVVKSSQIMNSMPAFLRPIVGGLLTSVPKASRRAMKHLKPIIEPRLRSYEEHGRDYPEKPNDMLSWLMDEASPDEMNLRSLTMRLLSVNFAAIHTTSTTFTQTLYNLAANPEYIAPLREEVERVTGADGWTKVAMTKMHKLDSFIKEDLRTGGLAELGLTRKALVDYTLSDGTFLPKGTFVSVMLGGIQNDDEYFPHAGTFDGFRFADTREEDGEGSKHQMVATSPEYLAFGHGKHACPGRFFAANEIKAMMAHLLLTYDFKLEVEGVRPPDLYITAIRIPNQTARLLFRKRQIKA